MNNMYYVGIILMLQFKFIFSRLGYSNFGNYDFNVTNLVIGGDLAKEKQFPYMVSLRMTYKYRTFHTCGGSILSKNWVITAAHCVIDNERSINLRHVWKDIEIYAGHIKSSNELVDGIKIKKVYVNPTWDDERMIGDLALLRVSQPFVFDYVHIKPLKLVYAEQPPGTQCTISGWGMIDPWDRNSVPINLQYLKVKVVRKSICNRLVVKASGDKNFQVGNSRICAGKLGKGYGACMGDSGGPLVCNGGLYGIASFVFVPCGLKNMVDFYTNVYFYTEWIVKCQENEKYCTEVRIEESGCSRSVFLSYFLLAMSILFNVAT